jgi:hypothetical protein
MRENQYQAQLIRRLERIFKGCFILKNDTDYVQGLPDLLILYQDRWAMLEVKAHEHADEQPNQRYYVDLFNGMSFAAFIYPENEDEVLDALQRSFKPVRATRLS